MYIVEHWVEDCMSSVSSSASSNMACRETLLNFEILLHPGNEAMKKIFVVA